MSFPPVGRRLRRVPDAFYNPSPVTWGEVAERVLCIPLIPLRLLALISFLVLVSLTSALVTAGDTYDSPPGPMLKLHGYWQQLMVRVMLW